MTAGSPLGPDLVRTRTGISDQPNRYPRSLQRVKARPRFLGSSILMGAERIVNPQGGGQKRRQERMALAQAISSFVRSRRRGLACLDGCYRTSNWQEGL